MIDDQVPALIDNLLSGLNADIQRLRDAILRIAHLDYIGSEKDDDVCTVHAMRSKIAVVSWILAARLTPDPSRVLKREAM
jgi:hypothetical protein